MNRLLRYTFLALFAFLIAPAFAADEKKDDPKPPPKIADKITGKKDAENKLIKAGEIAGEVVHVEPAKNSLRVKVTIPYTELNQGEYKAYIQEQINARNAAARGDRNAYANHLRAAVDHSNRLISVKSTSKEVPVDAADECKVRLAQPKASFDDMGNVKKFTQKELAALRGKDRLYDGEFSDLTVGQIVRVTFVKPKTPPPMPKNKDDINLDDYKLQASRIIIVTQPAPK